MLTGRHKTREKIHVHWTPHLYLNSEQAVNAPRAGNRYLRRWRRNTVEKSNKSEFRNGKKVSCMCHMFFVTVLVLLGAGLAANSGEFTFSGHFNESESEEGPLLLRLHGTYKAFLFTSWQWCNTSARVQQTRRGRFTHDYELLEIRSRARVWVRVRACVCDSLVGTCPNLPMLFIKLLIS